MKESSRFESWYFYGASVACGTALAFAAMAAHAQTDTRIVKVKLYPGSATVERVARVAAGAKKMVFPCLPAALDVQSLHVTADAAVRVGELSVVTEERESSRLCATNALDSRIRELEDQRALLEAEARALRIVDDYLKNVAASDPSQAGSRVAPDPKSIAAMADSLRRTGQDSQQKQHQISRQVEDLDRALKPLVAERSRTQSARGRIVNVSVTLDTTRDADVRLSYQISGPGWAPAYRALLNTTTGTLRLERHAVVAQATGEDWSNVQMQLSTGQPRRGTTGPSPLPWRIGIAPAPTQDTASRAQFAPAPAAAAPALPRGSSQAEITPLRESFDISVFHGSFATEFSVPNRIDVPSNGQRVTLALGTFDTTAKIIVRTVPYRELAAYLIAELAQPEGVWPAGPLQLYRDGTFAGTDSLRTGSAHKLELSFGRDDLVTVQADPVRDTRGTAGFVGTRIERKVFRAYTVESRHRTPVGLEVLETAPVAIDEQVKVENQFDPKPDSINWNNQPGATLWSTSLNAGKALRFTADYTISHPKDTRLQETR